VTGTDEDFRSEIYELARKAREELATRRAASAKTARARRLRWIAAIGGGLIAAEVGMLALQLSRAERDPDSGRAPQHRLASDPTCRGVRYRTFRALLSYRREHGRWPHSLAELLGRELRELPTDPATGLPLRYSSDGQRIVLQCPSPPGLR
jgi:hypothetical protein